MPGTLSSDLTNLAVTNYKKEYFRLAALPEYTPIHSQFVDWKETIPDRGGFGGTFDWPVFGRLNPSTTALTEGVDITPKSFKDYNITLSPREYGDVVSYTNLAQFKSRVDLQKEVADMISMARVQSQDMIVRQAIYGILPGGATRPTQTIHSDGSAVMTALDAATAGDLPTWAFFTQLASQARSRGIMPRDGTNFFTIIHPLMSYELKQTNEWKNIGYYQVPGNIYMAGEVGMFGGFRIIESPQAKIYWGAGYTHATSVATTVKASYPINAGDTTFRATSAANIAAGVYLTVGTAETETAAPGTNLEQIYVTAAVSDTDLVTIQGVGDGTNLGFRYAHAAGEAVTRNCNVGAIPVIGKNSLLGAHGSSCGRFGIPKFKEGLDLLDRIFYTGWYWYGGVTRVERNLILGKCALSQGTIGSD
jgi:N4-gp56 family major capsid protein